MSDTDSLPPPAHNQAYCDVSAITCGMVQLPLAMIIDPAADDEQANIPSLAFLLRHSSTSGIFLFDLGIPCQWREQLPPAMIAGINRAFGVEVTPKTDVTAALRNGGLDPAEITHVFLSHVHWDHAGDPSAFPHATFHVGAGSRALLADGFPGNADAIFRADLLPPARTAFEDPTGTDWTPLGPFPRARDVFGDGSVFLVDTPGHLPGHLGLLVRTAPDGGWLFLGGDAAHDRRLLTGAARVPCHAVWGCPHRDKAAAEDTIAQIAAAGRIPRVRVLIAHDVPFFEGNARGEGKEFFPGKIVSL